QYHDQLYKQRSVEGFVNLDDYKDWVLAWSDDTRAGIAAPSGQGPALKHVLDGFEGNDDRGMRWFSHFRQAEKMLWAVDVRKQLANPSLSKAQRGWLSAQVAAFCYLMAEPDFNTRASASHQGNPNMPINRFFALPFAAVLIPDHPLAAAWLDTSHEYTKYKLGINVTPGSGYSELMTYYGAAAPTYVHAALVADQAKRLDEGTRQLALEPVDFTLRMLAPPDPRFGFRPIPGFGHEGVLRFNQWLPAATLIKAKDPTRAALYAWAWEQQGQPGESQHCNGFAVLCADEGKLAKQAKPQAIRDALHSTWIPGFGAVLRSHGGDPNETYFGYRQGYLASHSDANQGDFVLYAKGAPLVTLSIRAYPLHQVKEYKELFENFGWHSVVRTGSQSNTGGWPAGGPVSGIHRHFLSDLVDYLRGEGDYSNTPLDGNDAGRDLTTPDAQRWTRQILFLKSSTPAAPNYFVFRDSLTSLDPKHGKLTPKWWNLRTLGDKKQIQAKEDGFTYTSAFGPHLDVHLLEPKKATLESRAVSGGGQAGGGAMGAFIDNTPSDELTVNALGPIPAGQDIVVVLYPRAADEAQPTYVSLGDGAAKITTSTSTDYVFQHPTGGDWKSGDVAFRGISGAVRVFPDAVHMIIAEGAGEVTFGGYTLKAGKPVTRIVPLAEIKRGGMVDVPADPTTINFSLNPQDGPIVDVQPGIQRQKRTDGMAYEFNATDPISFAKDDTIFEGRRGAIVVDTKAGTTRLVMIDGTRIGHGEALAEVASGPYDLTYHADHVEGIAEGPARLLYLSKPKGLTRMPCININGVRYAPGGYSGADGQACPHINIQDAIVPLRGGRFTFTLENLPQPPIFRKWKHWNTILNPWKETEAARDMTP
ncbi:MAG: hypothetical protein JXM70_25620, partial [Pirellulales bacterium]|nr:hypothetical protein [Pirellulales bacterium]